MGVIDKSFCPFERLAESSTRVDYQRFCAASEPGFVARKFKILGPVYVFEMADHATLLSMRQTIQTSNHSQCG